MRHESPRLCLLTCSDQVTRHLLSQGRLGWGCFLGHGTFGVESGELLGKLGGLVTLPLPTLAGVSVFYFSHSNLCAVSRLTWHFPEGR